ncbi:hypothetical protein VTI28DRAFT_3546 [Corynascus sepedonium]
MGAVHSVPKQTVIFWGRTASQDGCVFDGLTAWRSFRRRLTRFALNPKDTLEMVITSIPNIGELDAYGNSKSVSSFSSTIPLSRPSSPFNDTMTPC